MVLTANDGTEAGALSARNKDDIRGVLTGMMMPFIGEPTTIRTLQEMNTRVKILAAKFATEAPPPQR